MPSVKEVVTVYLIVVDFGVAMAISTMILKHPVIVTMIMNSPVLDSPNS